MNSEKLKLINEEVQSDRTPARKPQETFAFKLFTMGMKLAKAWLIFAAGVMIAQILLLLKFGVENPIMLPGIVPLIWVSGGVSVALIGGEEGVDIAKKLREGNTGGGQNVGR